MGGSLLETRTEQEYELASNAREKFEFEHMWLGGSDRKVEGEWRWESDGSEINRDEFWRRRQPNGAGDCLSIEENGLSDSRCSSEHHFICHLGYESFRIS